jgi:hypothetical protein
MAQRRRRATTRRDVDGAWKQVLRDLLPECIAFVHPDLDRAIDWSRTPEFMDKELQAVARRAATGRRAVDLLAKVWLRDGQERWLLIHIEVQGQNQDDFAERMYLYHTLLFLQHRRPIVSLARLIDGRVDWRPTRYTYDHWGSAVEFRYPAIKLLDWRGREAELAQDHNPFAQVALAQLSTLTSRGQLAPLAETRRAILRQLYRAGYGREYARAVISFMDWTLSLPDDIAAAIDEEVDEEENVATTRLAQRWEESKRRAGERWDARQARRQMLDHLEHRHGPLDDEARLRIVRLSDAQALALAVALLDFADRADLDRWLATHDPQ